MIQSYQPLRREPPNSIQTCFEAYTAGRTLSYAVALLALGITGAVEFQTTRDRKVLQGDMISYVLPTGYLLYCLPVSMVEFFHYRAVNFCLRRQGITFVPDDEGCRKARQPYAMIRMISTGFVTISTIFFWLVLQDEDYDKGRLNYSRAYMITLIAFICFNCCDGGVTADRVPSTTPC